MNTNSTRSPDPVPDGRQHSEQRGLLMLRSGDRKLLPQKNDEERYSTGKANAIKKPFRYSAIFSLAVVLGPRRGRRLPDLLRS